MNKVPKLKYTLLVIDDDDEFVEYLKSLLTREGYRVITALSADSGMNAIRNDLPDIILLDRILPDMDGIALCQMLKRDAKFSHIPIVMLTAKAAASDLITGLENGADDYVVKPFLPEELIARLWAVIRRVIYKGQMEEIFIVAGIKLNATQHKVFMNKKEVSLTLKEFDLLSLFIRKSNHVLKPSFIIESVWGMDSDIDRKSLEMHISNLRRKLGKSKNLIQTVRGVGYRFEA